MKDLDIRLRDIVSVVAKEEGVFIEDDILEKLFFAPIHEGFSFKFDFSTNVPVLLSKLFNISAEEVGERIASRLVADGSVDSFEIADKKFLNIKASNEFFNSVVINVIESGYNFGFSNIGNMEKVNIEYVSANPTGPMHIGHARGAVYGSVLSELLKKNGFDVTTEYYVNDAGSQIETLVKSTFLRYQQIVKGNTESDIPEGCYPGEYLIDVGKKVFAIYGDVLVDLDYETYNRKIRPIVLDEIMALIKADLKKININHDVYSYESALIASGKVETAIEMLAKKGLVYSGTTERPKGTAREDWEEGEKMLFKSTEFGDDADRPIKKSDGSFAYFASDIAYHYDKYSRGFKKMVLVLGADHRGYVKRVQAVVSAVSNGEAEIDVKLCELVTFVKDGKEVKSSKRSGNFVTLSDIIEQLDQGILRFIMLTRKNDTRLVFDINKALEHSRDNPVFYVQYAHSRCCSLIRYYEELFGSFSIDELIKECSSDAIQVDNHGMRRLISLLYFYPKVVAGVVRDHELQKLVVHIISIATAFHAIWNGKDADRMVFIQRDDKKRSASNIAVAVGVRNLLGGCLKVLGVEPLEKM